MKAYYDIHIHSVLSSCADVLQTPNNILNMCMLKELNMISICDHNTAKQYRTIDLIKDSYDFLVLYGMEITVKEGFHVLAYFERYEDVMMLDSLIDNSLDKSVLTVNEQIICDEYDEVIEKIPYNINQKIIYSFEEIIEIIRSLNGLIIPAHIDRKKTGILDHISDFSMYDIDAVEIYAKEKIDYLEKEKPFIKKFKYLFNSDSHDIEMINEKDNYIELDDLSFSSFKKWLKKANE